MAVSKEDVIQFIANMTVLELSELIKEMEEKFGVTAAAPVAFAGAMLGGPGAEGAAVRKRKQNLMPSWYPPAIRKSRLLKRFGPLLLLGSRRPKS